VKYRTLIFAATATAILGAAALAASSASVVAQTPDATATPPTQPDVATLKPAEIQNKPPLEVAKAAPYGTLRNPYTDNAEKIEEGKKLYFSNSCNGCHGGGGGGGMCPPLTNEVWVYGGQDDVLFRLISHGSQELQKTYNLHRKGSEGVVGPMPPFGEIIKSDDDLWKIIAFVHSLYKGSKKTW